MTDSGTTVDLARTERAALADTLAALGPGRPTLCDGWTTGDLLAHLLVRERRPDAAVGILLPAASSWTERAMAAMRRRPWTAQLDEFRAGPPLWNPMGWGPLDRLTNSVEMFVHHEDALRGGEDWSARELDEPTRAAVTELLRSPVLRSAWRAAPGGVTVRLTDGPTEQVLALRSGPDVVEITGGVADVVLWAAGRRHVEVALDGPPDAVAALTSASRGR